jgi:hypothetical protein
MKKLVYVYVVLILLLQACTEAQKRTTSTQRTTTASISATDDYQCLTYDQLLQLSKKEKKNTYCGSFYPIRTFTRFPRWIQYSHTKDKEILMLSPESSQYRVYLIIPKAVNEKVMPLIQKHQKFSFLYKPLGVHREKYPILLFQQEFNE